MIPLGGIASAIIVFSGLFFLIRWLNEKYGGDKHGKGKGKEEGREEGKAEAGQESDDEK